MALARALMTGTEVLLLDEPTAALDPEVAQHLMHALRRLRESTDLTIVMGHASPNRSALCQDVRAAFQRPYRGAHA